MFKPFGSFIAFIIIFLISSEFKGSNLNITDLDTSAGLTSKYGFSVVAPIKIIAPSMLLAVKEIETEPYPGFPTDMQSLLLPVLCRAEGSSCICERVFSSRFRTVCELKKMGADIRITDDGQCARIRGGCRLRGAAVDAPDLRGGAALIIAALGAEGITVINDTCHIQRGYEQIPETIRLLGGEACWLS